MNREIKFRAWDTRRKRFSDSRDLGVQSLHDTNCLLTDRDVYKVFAIRQHLDLIWLQFTGLRDKHGVEIYEGDILMLNGVRNNRAIHAAVEWSDEGRFIESDTRNTIGKLGSLLVIGNIYENPELLESK